MIAKQGFEANLDKQTITLVLIHMLFSLAYKSKYISLSRQIIVFNLVSALFNIGTEKYASSLCLTKGLKIMFVLVLTDADREWTCICSLK